jgi:hypothetical protein
VVSADEVDAVWIAELETYKQRDGLNREEPAIYVVACGRGSQLSARGTSGREVANVPRNR